MHHWGFNLDFEKVDSLAILQSWRTLSTEARSEKTEMCFFCKFQEQKPSVGSMN